MNTGEGTEMKSKRNMLSLTTAVVGALVLALTQPPVASAGVSATSGNVLTVNSATVRVFATASQTFTSTGVPLQTPVVNGTAKIFFVNNGGSRGVSLFTMAVTLPKSSNVSSFRYCALNTTFTGPTTCSNGSTATDVTGLTSGTAVNYPTLPASSYYSFRLVQNKTDTITVTTSASLSNVITSVTSS